MLDTLPVLESVGEIEIDTVVKGASTQDLLEFGTWMVNRSLARIRSSAVRVLFCRGKVVGVRRILRLELKIIHIPV